MSIWENTSAYMDIMRTTPSTGHDIWDDTNEPQKSVWEYTGTEDDKPTRFIGSDTDYQEGILAGIQRRTIGYTKDPALPSIMDSKGTPEEKFNVLMAPLTHVMNRIGGTMARSFGAMSKDDARKLVEDELDGELKWYQKAPELIGIAAATVAKYKLMQGLFAATKLGPLLDKAGVSVASKIFPAKDPTSLATVGIKEAIKNYGGIKAFTVNVARKAVERLPKSTQLMGLWFGLENVKDKKKFSDGYIKGMKWGAVLTTAGAAIGESADIISRTKGFEKAIIKFDAKFPGIAKRFYKFEPSTTTKEIILRDLKREAFNKGMLSADMVKKLDINNISQNTDRIITAMARRYEFVANKASMQRLAAMGPEATSKAAADAIAKDVKLPIAKKADVFAPDRAVGKAPVDKHTVQLMREASHLREARNIEVGKELLGETPLPATSLGETVNAAKEKLVDAIVPENTKLIKEIHVDQKAYRMSDTQYRMLAKETTGKSSTTKMSLDELAKFDEAIKKTNPVDNFQAANRELKAEQSGAEIISSDKNIAKVQKHVTARKERTVAKTNREVAKVNLGQYNYISHYKHTQNAFETFEDKTGLPVGRKTLDISNKQGKILDEAEATVDRVITGLDIDASAKKIAKDVRKIVSSMTKEENDRIAKWLYSAETRAEVEGLMSEKEKIIASRFEAMYQGPLARERMRESLRFWVEKGKAPSDVKQFSEEEQKNIIKIGKAALRQGKFKEFAYDMFDRGVRVGVRNKFYYQSDISHKMVSDQFYKHASETGIETLATDAVNPSLIESEMMARRGKAGIKPGSVFHNTLAAYQRVMVRNELADGLSDLFNTMNEVTMSAKDKLFMKEWANVLLLNREVIRPPFDKLIPIASMWWKARLSLLNTQTMLSMSARNSLQTLAVGGYAVNAKAFTASTAKISASITSGKGLKGVSSEMAADFKSDFYTTISQKQSIRKGAMFQEINAKLKAGKITAKAANLAKTLLEFGGGLYVEVDELSRMFAWTGSYDVVKNAADKYIDGKISIRQFLNKTNIDTMKNAGQVEAAMDLLSAGKSRELAKYIAQINASDIHFGYKLLERAGIVRKAEQRLTIGIYTYVEGRYSGLVDRGVKPLLDGITHNNPGKAYRAANNIAKGIIGSALADFILTSIPLLSASAAYRLSKISYSALQPAVSIAKETLDQVNYIKYRYAEGEINQRDAVALMTYAIYQLALEFVPTPTKSMKERMRKHGKPDTETNEYKED